MGSLVTAGILSGAGKAGTAALAMGQNYLQTSALLDERERWEDARAARNLAAQQGMHRETLAAHKEEGILTREDTRKMQKSLFDHTEILAEKQIDKMIELRQIESTERQALHRDTIRLAKAQARAVASGAVSVTPTNDGRLMVLMKDGSSHVMKDEKGVPVSGLKDIAKSTEILMTGNNALKLHYQDEIARGGPLMDEEAKRSNNMKIERLQKMNEILSGMSPELSAKLSSTSPGKAAVVDRFKPAAPQGTPTAPKTVPVAPQPTSPTSGLLEQGSVTAPKTDEELDYLLKAIEDAEAGR